MGITSTATLLHIDLCHYKQPLASPDSSERGEKRRERKMGRAPCCENMGLKKGPWTPEEDRILAFYIQTHGHGNWRALPKQAGLLRCGKSCRLRWTNYLRPDVKRGDFSKEEEETIIYLHAMLGNRWSAIAAKLPGRTDNEIKNVWHTHLKKRLNPNNKSIKNPKRRGRGNAKTKKENKNKESKVSSMSINGGNGDVEMKGGYMNSLEGLPYIYDILWSEALPSNKASAGEEEDEGSASERFDSLSSSSSNEDDISFWMNLLAEAGSMEYGVIPRTEPDGSFLL